MLLNKVLSQTRKGASISIQDMTDRLSEDTDMIKYALTLLCRMGYCEQITLFHRENNCVGCCGKSCTPISCSRANYWQLTHKGIEYLEKFSKKTRRRRYESKNQN